jgi:hypothetical protein
MRWRWRGLGCGGLAGGERGVETTMTSAETERLIRQYAAGEVSWSQLRDCHGLETYLEVLAELGELGLRPPMARCADSYGAVETFDGSGVTTGLTKGELIYRGRGKDVVAVVVDPRAGMLSSNALV